jgi:hypothetical protein
MSYSICSVLVYLFHWRIICDLSLIVIFSLLLRRVWFSCGFAIIIMRLFLSLCLRLSWCRDRMLFWSYYIWVFISQRYIWSWWGRFIFRALSLQVNVNRCLRFWFFLIIFLQLYSLLIFINSLRRTCNFYIWLNWLILH